MNAMGRASEPLVIDEESRHFIPAKEKVDIYGAGHIFRACAYCRVSTDSDMQLSSYDLQREHYMKLAGQHENWDMRHIYADEGISGTSLKHRDEFNEMIAACERGEYDLIVTKSVSRFARNLLDCVSLVRRLKNLPQPVGVFFETDNLFTLSEDSELKLSLLASFAQEESVKKRESQNWSLQERFKNGRLLMPELLGYEREKDASGRYLKDAKLTIIESEAEIVRFIFDAFLAGYTVSSIAEILTETGCQTKIGNTEWSEGSIGYILRNERYCGNVLTWKEFTVDLFEHKKKKNRQDRDQYLYKGVHDAIIPVEKFEAVQTLLLNRHHYSHSVYSTMHVIHDGIFRGYVPVDYRWVNASPRAFYEASNSVEVKEQPRKILRSYFSEFNLAGYQVVRGQFLTRKVECPCLTITPQKITFNIECIRKFNDAPYVQLLIHPTERRIAIRPCTESDAHVIKWHPDLNKPLTTKSIGCPYFAETLYQILQWNPDYNHRVSGTWVSNGIDQIIYFDLENAVPFTYVSTASENDEKPKRIRMDMVPEEWDESFGEEFYAFSIQNSFYYLDSKRDWKAGIKSQEIPPSSRMNFKTQEEIQLEIENLRLKAGGTLGD